MQIIGITGGIGSGKSTIANELAKRGYTVYDCDREAKRIIAENAEVQQAIMALLGPEAFVNGIYNTRYVAKRVFSDDALLTRLNAIIHPAILNDILTQQPDFVESAILYESRLATICDKIILIDAPQDIRIARTIARDYNGEATPDNIEKVRARMHAQPSSVETHVPAPYIILNDGCTPIDDLVSLILQKSDTLIH